MSAVDTRRRRPLTTRCARPSPLPFALPPFDEITVEHCREALLAGMAEQRAEVAAIVAARTRRPSRTPSSRSSAPASC